MEVLFRVFYLTALACFGLVFGSFANVVIWRLPRGESLVRPGSHCPRCQTPIRWFDNIPVVSWLLLRARCRNCGQPIPGRYPLVEAVSGVLWVAGGLRFGATPRAAAAIVFFYLLLVLAFIDLDTMRLPNPIVAVLAAFGLVGALVSTLTAVPICPLFTDPAGGVLKSPLGMALVGAVLGSGIAGLLMLAYGMLRGRTGMGMGDVKLLFAMGLYLGPYVLGALFVGSLIGSIGGFLSVRRSADGPVGQAKFAFGPYLALGGVLTALFGPVAWGWYAGMLDL